MAAEEAGQDITTALEQWAAGDATALQRIAPVIYPKLRDLAGAFFRGERAGHTWQATALVSELFLKLAASRGQRYENRQHFYNACARMMRLALIDHARGIQADKRGGGLTAVPFHPEMAWLDATSPVFLDLDRALDELGEMDEAQAAMFEAHYLLGLSIEEIAQLNETSKSTVDRKIRVARAWLYRRLNPQEN